MQFSLDIAERVNIPCNLRRLLLPIFRATVERAWEDDMFDDSTTLSLSVVFVSSEEIHKLNREYLHHDYPTDVLSFPNHSPQELCEIRTLKTTCLDEELFLGEVIVCYDEIVRASKEDSVSEIRELAFIVSHGILHLLGFRHSERMFSLQDDVADALDGH